MRQRLVKLIRRGMRADYGMDPSKREYVAEVSRIVMAPKLEAVLVPRPPLFHKDGAPREREPVLKYRPVLSADGTPVMEQHQRLTVRMNPDKSPRLLLKKAKRLILRGLVASE